MEARIDALIAQMTLPEKVAQMRIFHANADARILNRAEGISIGRDGTLVYPPSYSQRWAHGIAGIKNPGEFAAPAVAARLTNALQRRITDANRLRIPALFVGEAYNGLDAAGTTKFARPITMAASWNPALVGEAWDVVGREARLRGFHMIHSPVADMHRDPRFGRMSEGYGEDTHLAAAMVTAAVRGVQGGADGPRRTHIGAVTKHFVGYGQVDGGRNFASVTISPRDLIDQYLPPFRAAVVDACAVGIMPSHGDINGIATHGNRALLTDVLRGEWGFQGYVVSDAEDVARLASFMGVAETAEDAARLGLLAGVDIDLYSERAYTHLPAMAAADPALVPAIDMAVRRVLRAKFRLGLFDRPFVDPAAAERGTRTQRSLDLALRLDLDSAILLQNRGDILPLSVATAAAPRRMALIGPAQDAGTLATFQRIAGPHSSITSEAGVRLTDQDRANPQLVPTGANTDGIARAVSAAMAADVAILMLGDDEYTAREAFFATGVRGDRASLDLAGDQDALLSAVAATGRPIIVVLKHRRTLSVNGAVSHADAILDMWEPGERGDEAAAMLIAGLANPAGRLPVTVPRSAGHLPAYYSQRRINFHKDYLFSETGPLFPFGVGLSYTRFVWSDMRLSSPTMRPDAPITATVTIRNVGQRSGSEVAQLYIADPVASVTRPFRELRGFAKFTLAPGETRNISFAITPEMLRHTGADMRADPGYGAFTIGIARHAADMELIAPALFER